MVMTERELAALARDIVRLLPERATIERSTEVVDRYGVSTRSYNVVVTEVPCRVAPLRTSYEAAPEQLRLRGDVAITLLRGVAVEIGDRVTVGTRRYRVVDLLEPGTLGVTTRVGAEVTE